VCGTATDLRVSRQRREGREGGGSAWDHEEEVAVHEQAVRNVPLDELRGARAHQTGHLSQPQAQALPTRKIQKSGSGAPILSFAANDAYQMTWCCIQKLCINIDELGGARAHQTGHLAQSQAQALPTQVRIRNRLRRSNQRPLSGALKRSCHARPTLCVTPPRSHDWVGLATKN
jgi:hypothetical protein